MDMITGLVNITAGMVEQMDPFLEAVGSFLQGMADGDEETQKTVGKILLLAKAVEAAGIAFVAAVIAIDEYKLSIAGAFKVIAGGAQMVWNVVALMADAIQGAFVVVEGLLIAFVEKITLGLANLSPKFRDFKAIVTDSGKQVSKSIDTDAADFTRGMDKMIAGFNDLASIRRLRNVHQGFHGQGSDGEKDRLGHIELDGECEPGVQGAFCNPLQEDDKARTRE